MSKNPKPGEIWLVQFEPNVGSEIDKARPAIVISVEGFTNLPLRIVVPIRGSSHDQLFTWFIPLERNAKNNLAKDSEIDASQIHAFDLNRFIRRVGEINANQLEDVRSTAALCIGV